ncbi:MAG: zinc ABC transporter substrate-binding protein [Mycobacterium kyogaense]|uniref:metal ABC transporter solute-binding protein, Zn/Mn family n=1 Tax=Mycobacterium kyogaense TaxID=2212479 RepID=UPI002FFBD01A
MRFSVLLVPALLMSTLTGCSQTPPNAEHGTANVVASTGAWASVAAAVVGRHATVRSLMPADADPRAFTPGDAAVSDVADASLVLYNGGRYDQWIAPILENSPDIPRIDALSLTPLQPPADDHVFYDLLTAKAVADRIADTLGESDAEHASDYTAAAQQFDDDLDTLVLAQHAIGQAHPGASVISITPVATYAIRNAGIADKTPPTFAEALEQSRSPDPADVAAVRDLITTRSVSALVVDDQAKSGVFDTITAAARGVALPMISISSTLPDGMSYLQWQRTTVDHIAAALNSPN